MPRVTSYGSSQSFLPTQNGIERSPSSTPSLKRLTLSSTPNLQLSATPKTPKGATSHSFMAKRASSMTSPHLSPVRRIVVAELPTIHNDDALLPFGGKSGPVPVRAAESGTGSLLPTSTSTAAAAASSSTSSVGPRSRVPSVRTSSLSGSGLKQVMNLGQLKKSSPTLPQTQQDVTSNNPTKPVTVKQSLRRRTYSSTPSDDDDIDEHDYNSVASQHNRLDSPYRPRERRQVAILNQLKNLSQLKLGHILQVIIVLVVTALVWESHQKALFAAKQLSLFKEEESLLLLHLKKIEQQSIQLHENMSRLAQSGIRQPDTPPKKDVDYDLIHQQAQQLYQMEEELNSEVKTLQTRIQRSARSHIISEYGEGPIQVVLELDFGDDAKVDTSNSIHILLWHDTPHAAWTWLDQIGRHVWDGAKFDWQQGHILDALPVQVDPNGGKIEFVENSQHSPEAWTVGLRETNGKMTIYINLQDNSKINKHETCVGKLIDGFDALQRVLEVARSEEGGGDAQKAIISVRKASAIHVTKK